MFGLLLSERMTPRRPPADPDNLRRWKQSERITTGVIAGTALELYLELVRKYVDRNVWELWKAIEASTYNRA